MLPRRAIALAFAGLFTLSTAGQGQADPEQEKALDRYTNVIQDADLVGQAKNAMELRNYNAALSDWDQLWDRYPGSPEISHWVGSTLVRLGRLAEAEAAFKHGLRLDPESSLLRDSLARTLIREGRLVEALKQWELLLKAQPDDEYAPNLKVLQRQVDRYKTGPGTIGAQTPLQTVWGPYYFSADLASWRRSLDNCAMCIDTESIHDLVKSQLTDFSFPRRFAKFDTAQWLQSVTTANLVMNEITTGRKTPYQTDRRFFVVLVRAGEPIQILRPRRTLAQVEPLPDIFPGDELLPVLYFKKGQEERACDDNVGVSMARYAFVPGRPIRESRLAEELKLFEATEDNSKAIRTASELLILPTKGPLTAQEGVLHLKATGMCPEDTLDRNLHPYDIALPIRSKNPMGNQELAQEKRTAPWDLRTQGNQVSERSIGGTWYQTATQPPTLPSGPRADGTMSLPGEPDPFRSPYTPDYQPGVGGPPTLDLPVDNGVSPDFWPWGNVPGHVEEYAEPWTDQ